MNTEQLKTLWKTHYGAVLFGALGVLLAIVFGVLSVYKDGLLVVAAIVGLGTLLVVLRSPWRGLLLLTFFLPFERIGSLDIGGGTTIRVSQVLIAFLALSLFMAIGRSRGTWKWQPFPVAIPLLVYLTVAGVALLNAPNLTRAVSVLAFVAFTMLGSAMVSQLVNTEEKAVQVARTLMWALAAVGLFGIYQFVGDWVGLPPALTGLRELYTKEVLGFPRVQSTALEPLYYANYLLIPLSILLSLFITQTSAVAKQWKVVAIFGLGVLNLVLTVARGGYIAFAASVTVLLLYYFFTLRLLTARTIAYGAAAVIVLGIVASQLLSVGAVVDKAATHIVNLFAGASYEERIQTIELSQKAFSEHPLVGIGTGSFGPYQSWHPMVTPDTGWAIVNNIYLEVLAETGVLGFLALATAVLIVVIRTFYALKYSQSDTVSALLVGAFAAFVGVLVQYNTFSILYIVHIWYLIGLLIALQNIALQHLCGRGDHRGNRTGAITSHNTPKL